MTMHIPRSAILLLLTCLISACGSHAPETPQPRLAVSTAQPVKQQFTHDIDAFGSVISDPRHTRNLSLAHGGAVKAVLVGDGQSVQAGHALFKIATAPAARKAYKQAQNALQLARGNLKRVKQLAGQHLATQAQVNAARSAAADARSTLEAQRQLGGGQAVQTVVAPEAGVVTHIQVARGQRVSANATLASFVPSRGLVAKLGVQPDQAMNIRSGMVVTLHSVYGAIDGAQGKVVMIGHAIDTTTQLVPVRVSLPATWGTRLAVGAAVSGVIHTTSYRAWAVPRGALQSDAQGDHVFQVEQGKAKRVSVKVLNPNGSPIAIAGALDPQAPVITQGSYEVADGEAVQMAHANRSNARESTPQ